MLIVRDEDRVDSREEDRVGFEREEDRVGFRREEDRVGFQTRVS